MDQITVSDIPLPGEEYSFKTDNQPTNDDASKKNETTEEVKPVEKEEIHTEIEPSTTENAESKNQNVEITTEIIEFNATSEIQVQQPIPETCEKQHTEPDNQNIEPKVKEIVEDNEVEKIAAAFLEDVTEAEPVQVECVTSEIITETVEELQMEVAAVAIETPDKTEAAVEEQVVEDEDESMEALRLEESCDETEVQPTDCIETIEITECTTLPTETKSEEIVEGVVSVSEETSLPIIEEPPTPAIEEIVEENITSVEEIPETVIPISKPAKKTTRTNSTIEAIKNDWTDSLTIEEIDEEMTEEAKPEAEPEPEPIIIEPDKKQKERTVDEKEKTVDEKEKTVDEKKKTIDEKEKTIDEKEKTKDEKEKTKDEKEKTEDEKEETIDKKEKIIEEKGETIGEKEETVIEKKETVIEKKEAVDEKKVTEVVMVDAMGTEIVATVAENVTIEIIDSTQQPPDKHEETENKTDVQGEQEHKETVYIVEEVANNNKQKPSAAKRARPSRTSPRISGAKDDKLQIPCHVLGRNVDNPTEDLISNGRTPPKPRLGVKVPYRFLTSQIVTKEEIADELIELTNKRNPVPDPPAGGDIFFASKLTQRLASKIALNVNKKPNPKTTDKTVESTSGIPTEALASDSVTTLPTTPDASSSKLTKNTIGDNSDLLAILEGDVDVDWAKEIRNTKPTTGKTNDTEVLTETKVLNVNLTTLNRKAEAVSPVGRKMDPATERQLALKQLREMPKKDGRGRPRKYHHLYETKQPLRTSLRVAPKKEVEKTPAPEPAPVKKETVPIKKESAPIKKESAPIKKESTPIKKESAPTKKELESAASPPKEKTTPAVPSADTSENIKQAVNKLAKKIKENENNVSKEKNEKLSELENDLNLTPKRVTKTYSRKEAVLDVPAELDYIVNEPETATSALAESDSQPAEDKSNKDASKTANTEKQKKVESPVKVQAKKIKRSASDINKPEVTLVSKRARIIKKKVIWDPAEVPKTKVLNAIRKAQVLEMKARKKQQKSEPDEESSEEEEEEKPTKQPQKKEQEKKNVKVAEKPSLRQRQLRRNKILPRATLSKVQKAKYLISRRSLRTKFVRGANGELKPLSKKKKKRGSPNKPKKTELDRLLGDEGAVNMLYAVRQAQGRTGALPRELSNRKQLIKDVITQHVDTSPTAKELRKKESPSLPPLVVPPRKKSRDSVRSSLQSPPPSPSYFHPQRAEASRIIRRHSSSFSSDCSSPRRLSVDDVRVLRRKVKEETKLSQAEKRKLNVEMSKNFDKTPKKRTRSSKGDEDEDEPKPDVKDKAPEIKSKPRFSNVQTDYKEILLKKWNNFYQIVMNSPANAKLKDVISVQMFHELNSVLTKLSKDDSCKVVALMSAGKSFCNGLDFSSLIQTTAEKRSIAAQDMTKTLKEFILSLAKFPKPLIAVLHSSSSLLGCTMLPYFDVVLAAETTILHADYARLGHGPEGAVALALGSAVGPSLARDLLMFGGKLTAKEALDKGLVTRVEPKEKLDELVGKLGAEICERSQQSLMATKSLLRQPMLQKLEEALELEQKLLVEQWPSSECQQNFKKLLQEEELW